METKQLQRKIIEFVDLWKKTRNYQPTEEFNVLHLVEEIGELAKEYVNQKIRPQKFSSDKLDNAIADILFQVIALADSRGLDVEELLVKTMNEDQPRINVKS